MSATLRLATIEDGLQQADDATFNAHYKAWKLKQHVALPEEQLKLICAIFFNKGVARGVKSCEPEISELQAHIADLNSDIASVTETTEDDGLSEYERLGRGDY